MADVDKYGIPPGGNNGAYTIKWYTGNKFQLNWAEMVASVALGGWPESKWAEAVAVSAAESSRQPFIYNTYKLGHFGLFQISRSAWPDFFKAQGNLNDLSWISYELNAKQGYEIYRRQGWRAWSAHSNGSYLAFLPNARAAVAAVKKKGTDEKSLRANYRQKAVTELENVLKADPTAGYPGSTIDDLQHNASDAAGALVDTITPEFVKQFWESITTPKTWMRFAYGATGIILVAGGLFLIVSRSPAAKKVINTASNVVPQGKALKAVKGAA